MKNKTKKRINEHAQLWSVCYNENGQQSFRAFVIDISTKQIITASKVCQTLGESFTCIAEKI